MNTTSRRRLRRARGFTLLEAMMASVIFLMGVTGVTIFASRVGLITRRGLLNNQMAQIARDEINKRTIAGLAGLGASAPGQTHQLPSGQKLNVDTEIFDTSGAPMAELPGQLPECANISFPSQCVRVTVTDKSTQQIYQTATYVTN